MCVSSRPRATCRIRLSILCIVLMLGDISLRIAISTHAMDLPGMSRCSVFLGVWCGWCRDCTVSIFPIVQVVWYLRILDYRNVYFWSVVGQYPVVPDV